MLQLCSPQKCSNHFLIFPSKCATQNLSRSNSRRFLNSGQLAVSWIAVQHLDQSPSWLLISVVTLIGIIWIKPCWSVLDESTQRVSVTLVFSFMANVGVGRMLNLLITSKEPLKTASEALEREMPISCMLLWWKVQLNYQIIEYWQK